MAWTVSYFKEDYFGCSVQVGLERNKHGAGRLDGGPL